MTSGIFETWLKKFDKRMGRKGRKFLLFLDNASSHSNVQLCNVKLKYLPANTTSILQPLDQGIILAMKQIYRKTQLRYIITKIERSKEQDCSQLLKETNVLKAIYWIKQGWNYVKCDTIAKCFKKCGFVDNTAEHLAEELFGATVDELREIDANNEENDDDDDDNEIDFNLVAEKVLNHSIYELIEAESLLKTSDDVEINWEANACDIIEALEEKEKAESEEEGKDATDDYSTDTVISSFPTALNVIYLKQFLMNEDFTDVVQELPKVESKIEKEFVKQQQRASQTSITDFFGLS